MSSPYMRYNELGNICVQCSTKDNLEIHHKNGNRKDNNLSNLILLCHKCHVQYHLKTEGKRRLVGVFLPVPNIQKLDSIVEKGFYPNRNEAIRAAVRDLIRLHIKET